MIEYQKHFGSFHLLFRLYGSPWPRAALLALPSTALAVLVKVFLPDATNDMFLSPVTYQIFGSTMAFLLIFRINLSYNRYWEGCTTIRNMASFWGAATIQVIAFDEAAEKENKVPGGLRFRSEFIHTMSLMHGLALLRLRGDTDLSNIVEGDLTSIPAPPPSDAGQSPDWRSWWSFKGLFALRVAKEHYQAYWKSCPLPVLGGINPHEGVILEASHDRVFLVLCWILRMIGARRFAGGIKSESSLTSRIYQTLSDGLSAYENAYKLTTTPFPFPYAQSVSLLLLFNAIICPLTMARWTGYTWLVGVMTFLAVFTVYLLNEVASEIEEPFKFDPNDLPVMMYQHKFNEHMVTAFVKSLFPEEEEVFFNQIEEEEKMKELVEMSRPSTSDLRFRSKSLKVSTSVEAAKKTKPTIRFVAQESGPNGTPGNTWAIRLSPCLDDDDVSFVEESAVPKTVM